MMAFNKKLILIVTCFSLISCVIRKSQGIVIDRDGYTFYEDSINNLRLKFPGDYSFHEFDKKYFLNASNQFLEYSTIKLNGKKPELLFASHTKIPPLHSVIGIVYKGVFQDSGYLNELKNAIKDKLKGRSPKQTHLYSILGDVIKWEYQVLNPYTKIYSTHVEFIIKRKDDLLRFLFWSIESNLDGFNIEPEGIVLKIKAF